ncbi:MAG TPA: tetratricopeptide repeat protein [Terriglobia bacterium]|nr:tetratricopeptide repeat protein [Terriglobia bacterium]
MPNDPSAAFTAHLSLPPAQSEPWNAIRQSIVNGNFTQAENRLRSSPPSADHWLWQGVLLLHERKTFASIRSLEQSARIKDTSLVETLLAVDYFLLNQRSLAVDAIQRALHFDAQNMMALYLRGRLEFVSASFRQARNDFSAVLAAEPRDFHSLYYLGFCEWRLGQNDEARKTLLDAVEVLTCHHLRFPLAPYTLAQLELNAGASQSALAHINLAVQMAEAQGEKDSEFAAKALALRGRIESALGRRADAERDLEQSVKEDPLVAESWYSLAHLYQEEGKKAQAAEALNQFRKIQGEL